MAALAPGIKAPDFQLSDHNGEEHSLSDALRKGPVVLTFFKISCPTCQYAIPFFDRLAPKLKGRPATLWSICQDGPVKAAGFNEEFGVSLTELFDSEEENYPVSNAFGLTNVPTSFFIEKDGTIALTSVGWDKKEVEQISKYLGEAASLSGLTPFEQGETVVDFQAG